MTMLSIKRGDLEKEYREEVEMKLKVGHWSVERQCQRGVVIQDGLSCDRWGAQRGCSCTMTVFYNAEYVERGKRGCREKVEMTFRFGVQKGSVIGG